MKHSIEEKLIKLYQTKRDLVNDLLNGSNVSAKITDRDLDVVRHF